MRRTAARPIVAVVALAALTCAGCARGDGDTDETLAPLPAPTVDDTVDETAAPNTADDDPPASSPTDETLPSASTSSTTSSTTSIPASATTTLAPLPPEHGECLVGTWVVTDDEMNAFYDGLAETVDGTLRLSATGSATLTISDSGTYQWAPDFELTVDAAGVHGTGHTTGTIRGTWTALDGHLTATAEDNALVLEIEVDGITFSGTDLANGLLTASPIDDVAYSCAGPTPVIDFRTADPAVFVPVRLAPA